MTGKEALIRVSKSCSGLALEFGSVKIYKEDNEALQTLKEIVQKYDKYKRGFEILKEKLDIKRLCENSFICNGAGYYRGLTLEEYEILEELMKGEI